MNTEIKRPEWLEIVSDGQVSYGLNQEWFPSLWQRKAGCGPTAAATLLLYLNKRDNGPLPYQNHDIPSAAKAMEDVWKFITPGLQGLNSAQKFVSGMDRLLCHYQAPWSCRMLCVEAREPVGSIAQFLEAGISSDCPIAFLNLHAGTVSAFNGFHWIVLTALMRRGQDYIATGYDGSRKIEFSLGQWISTTKAGGGFVYLA